MVQSHTFVLIPVRPALATKAVLKVGNFSVTCFRRFALNFLQESAERRRTETMQQRVCLPETHGAAARAALGC